MLKRLKHGDLRRGSSNERLGEDAFGVHGGSTDTDATIPPLDPSETEGSTTEPSTEATNPGHAKPTVIVQPEDGPGS